MKRISTINESLKCYQLFGRLSSHRNLISSLLLCFLVVTASFTCEANPLKQKKKICVIGAGLSGLASAKHVAEFPNEFDLVVFEKNNEVGGQWAYTEQTGLDNHGLPIHSSVYQNLR